MRILGLFFAIVGIVLVIYAMQTAEPGSPLHEAGKQLTQTVVTNTVNAVNYVGALVQKPGSPPVMVLASPSPNLTPSSPAPDTASPAPTSSTVSIVTGAAASKALEQSLGLKVTVPPDWEVVVFPQRTGTKETGAAEQTEQCALLRRQGGVIELSMCHNPIVVEGGLNILATDGSVGSSASSGLSIVRKIIQLVGTQVEMVSVATDFAELKKNPEMSAMLKNARPNKNQPWFDRVAFLRNDKKGSSFLQLGGQTYRFDILPVKIAASQDATARPQTLLMGNQDPLLLADVKMMETMLTKMTVVKTQK